MLKKIKEGIRDKAITAAVVFMLTTGGAFLVNSGKDIIELPQTVRKITSDRRRDSAIYMNMWITRIKYQDSVNRAHSLFLQQDFDTLRSIKWKLKRHKIR